MDDIKEKSKESASLPDILEMVEKKQESKEVGGMIEREDLQKAKRIIEGMQIDDDVKLQTQTTAQNLTLIEEEQKLAELLKLAKSKGVIFAVTVAKKMNDPYILDLLHDKLAENGYYKDFLK